MIHLQRDEKRKHNSKDRPLWPRRCLERDSDSGVCASSSHGDAEARGCHGGSIIESIETSPIQEYFVNKWIELLFSRSEIDRVDYRRDSETNIFMAERKYWLGLTSDTINACALVICSFILFCLGLTAVILQVRKQRVI